MLSAKLLLLALTVLHSNTALLLFLKWKPFSNMLPMALFGSSGVAKISNPSPSCKSGFLLLTLSQNKPINPKIAPRALFSSPEPNHQRQLQKWSGSASQLAKQPDQP